MDSNKKKRIESCIEYLKDFLYYGTEICAYVELDDNDISKLKKDIEFLENIKNEI